MKSICRLLGAFVLLFSLISCTEKPTAAPPSIVEEISGVWRATDGTLMSIIFGDKKIRMLVGDIFIPVSLGDVDNVNKTVNMNVPLKTGKSDVWTLAQVWDKDKTSFHLRLTLGDGKQDEFSFIRKISTDDLNRIANLEARSTEGSVGAASKELATIATAAPEAQHADPVPSAPAIPETVSDEGSSQGQQAAAGTWSPSFDCAKAAVEAERLVCASKELSDADVKLARAYSEKEKIAADKAALKRSQIAWMKNERDVCYDTQCVLAAYQSRTGQLASQ